MSEEIDGLPGSIDEVCDGWVYGRLYKGEEDLFFDLPLLEVPECQRVELQPGSYCTFLNGHLLIEKTMWSSHEIEQGDKEAARLWAALFGPR